LSELDPPSSHHDLASCWSLLGVTGQEALCPGPTPCTRTNAGQGGQGAGGLSRNWPLDKINGVLSQLALQRTSSTATQGLQTWCSDSNVLAAPNDFGPMTIWKASDSSSNTREGERTTALTRSPPSESKTGLSGLTIEPPPRSRMRRIFDWLFGFVFGKRKPSRAPDSRGSVGDTEHDDDKSVLKGTVKKVTPSVGTVNPATVPSADVRQEMPLKGTIKKTKRSQGRAPTGINGAIRKGTLCWTHNKPRSECGCP
jgi:hypothetical protein